MKPDPVRSTRQSPELKFVFADQLFSGLFLRQASLRRRFVFLTMMAALLFTPGLLAQARIPLPQPVPLPAPVEAPKDTAYAGIIELHVDATDVLRHIYQIRETVPVATAGPLTFLFPQWTPGDHAPNEALEKLTGLVITAKGTRLPWLRDTVDVHAIRVEIPAGVHTIELQYQYLGGVSPATGPVLITPTMLDLQWQSVILYPAGYFTRDILYRPSVTFPPGWTYFTSLDGGAPDSHSGRNSFTFPAIALDALIDQPVMAGQYLKQVVLSENPVPVRLDVAAQSLDDLAALPEAAKRFAALMPEAYKLFGSHHYDHYDHMLFLSDELSTYFEHHRSGENSRPADYLKSLPKSPAEIPDLSLLSHGYVHSWNGMYRRPAEMWTPNLNTPERDSMLWVFEGLTCYWSDVLSFRAGLFTQDDMEKQFSDFAAALTVDVGADWRSLEDVNNDPLILGRKNAVWPSWQRNMFDAYEQGEMIWLEADAIIRRQSGDKKSLDDFARSFFGGHNDAGDVTSTYTFDEMVAALNAVQPYDWQGFLRSRLDGYGQGRLAHSIDQAGYKLIFTDKPENGQPSKSLDLAYSLGMRVTASGGIYTVIWGSPAFKASLIYGETIVSINGKPYDPQVFMDAIQEAAKGGPLDLIVKRGAWQQSTSIAWQGGMRYPHLERIPGSPAFLDEILASDQRRR